MGRRWKRIGRKERGKGKEEERLGRGIWERGRRRRIERKEEIGRGENSIGKGRGEQKKRRV